MHGQENWVQSENQTFIVIVDNCQNNKQLN